ncbi:MAG: hypothetical protein C3F15_02040 [Holophagae bacterium]|nr:MAG: hypothetical protein C3F15_02040 [Holophagae bacterium]
MKATRVVPCLLIVVVAIGVFTGCKKGPTKEETKLAEMKQTFATLQQQTAVLEQARAKLTAAEGAAAAILAIEESKRTPEQKTMLAQTNASIAELTTAQDAAFEAAQATLADFLNVGLNDFPQAPETKQALDLYTREALLVADDMVRKAGDYAKAVDHLNGVDSLYDQVGLPHNPAIKQKLDWLDDWRYITQERFDAVKNNMTMDEVRTIAGVPYYANIQEDQAKGIETWLYRKRDGGAAAFYFTIKTGKVYGKNYEAIKTKVVA